MRTVSFACVGIILALPLLLYIHAAVWFVVSITAALMNQGECARVYRDL